MILRILKTATMPGGGTFWPGAVVNIPKDVAEGWVASGKARFHDGSPYENKMVTPSENKAEVTKKVKPKKKRKK